MPPSKPRTLLSLRFHSSAMLVNTRIADGESQRRVSGSAKSICSSRSASRMNSPGESSRSGRKIVAIGLNRFPANAMKLRALRFERGQRNDILPACKSFIRVAPTRHLSRSFTYCHGIGVLHLRKTPHARPSHAAPHPRCPNVDTTPNVETHRIQPSTR